MSTKNNKTVLVICNKPTSTLTKGRAYDAVFVKKRTLAIFNYWGRTTGYQHYQDSYLLTNNKGKKITVLASRFTVKK